MPYSVEWFVPGRVVLERAFGNVTIEELRQFNAEVTREIDVNGITPVHVIVDLTEIERYPINIREITNTMRNSVPNKVGWMLVVTENPAMRFVASMVFQLAQLRLRMFRTRAEALKFLHEMDDTLAKAGMPG